MTEDLTPETEDALPPLSDTLDFPTRERLERLAGDLLDAAAALHVLHDARPKDPRDRAAASLAATAHDRAMTLYAWVTGREPYR